MSPDPEQAARSRLARQVIGFVLACDVLVTLSEVVFLPAQHTWQHLVGLTLGVAFFAIGVIAYRRALTRPQEGVELLYASMLVTPLVSGLFVGQPLTLVGTALAAMIVVTAPRLLPVDRVDRWVLIAVLGAIVLSAEDLLAPPFQVTSEARGDFYDSLFVVALLAIGARAVRDFPGYPLKSKFTLASLLIALAPMLVARVDSQRRLAAIDLEAGLKDVAYRTSRAADAWDALLAHRLSHLRAVARGASLLAACGGDTDELPNVERELRRLLADDGLVRGVALWDRGGRRLVAVGEPFPVASPPRLAVELVASEAVGEHLVLGAPVQVSEDIPLGALALALRPGVLREWSADAATKGLSLVLRDRQRRPLFSNAAPELVAELPSPPVLPAAATSLAVPPPRVTDDGVVTARLGGGRVLAAVGPIASADWSLALIRSDHELVAGVDERTRRLQWITLLVAALSGLGAFLLARRLAAPIAQLGAAMARFTSGHTDVRAPFTSADEIGELARRFDLMAAQVGGLVRSLEQQTQRLQIEVAERSEQERKLQALNKELTAATDKAEAANRAKSTFLAHMSHELRTPLNAVIGYGEMLHDQAQEQGQEELARDTGHIVRAAQHLLEIINDILVLSKIEAGKMDMALEEFDAAKVAREVADFVRPMVAAGGNHLFVHVDREPARMFSDRTKLRQALLNLLGNAAKFTEGGEVALRLDHQTIGGLACLSFSVRDTGLGIPEGALPTLFDPFTQVAYPTVRKQSGTGLGLAITRRLCRQMGGEIDVVSKVGAGSTFTLTIPAVYKGTKDSDSWRPLRTFRSNDDSSKGRLPR